MSLQYDQKELGALLEYMTTRGYELLEQQTNTVVYVTHKYKLSANNWLLRLLKQQNNLNVNIYDKLEPVAEDFEHSRGNGQYFKACWKLYWNFREAMFDIPLEELPRYLHEANDTKRSLIMFRIETGK